MTLEEFIVSRSYLPKDGTHTILEHLQALDMNITGTYVGEIVKKEEVTGIVVTENVVTIDIKSNIINTDIKQITTDISVVQATKETAINDK